MAELQQTARARLEEGEEMDDADQVHLAAISRQWREAFTVSVPAAGGDVALRSGSGGFMGDASEPEIFM
eukprot:297514-Pyramimonas_sp.AAC.1